MSYKFVRGILVPAICYISTYMWGGRFEGGDSHYPLESFQLSLSPTPLHMLDY